MKKVEEIKYIVTQVLKSGFFILERQKIREREIISLITTNNMVKNTVNGKNERVISYFCYY